MPLDPPSFPASRQNRALVLAYCVLTTGSNAEASGEVGCVLHPRTGSTQAGVHDWRSKLPLWLRRDRKRHSGGRLPWRRWCHAMPGCRSINASEAGRPPPGGVELRECVTPADIPRRSR